MNRTLSSQKFIGFTVIVVLVLLALWFVVPVVSRQVSETSRIARNYIVSVSLSSDERTKTEQDIRNIEDEIKRGNTKGAANMFQQYIRLGNDFETIGRLDLAIDAYKKASQNDASFVAYAHMGSAYTTAHDYELAKDAFQQAIGKAPKEPKNYQKLAELYWHQLDQIAVARGVYIQGLVGTNQELGIMKSYASFLEQTGYTSESLMYWQAILKSTPKDQAVKDHIKALTSLKQK